MIKNYQRAFGLIEVVISSAIILIIAGAALNLERLAVKNSVVSYERTQAYNLARESLEVLREKRDNYWKEPGTSGLTAGFTSDKLGDWQNSINNDFGNVRLGNTDFGRNITVASDNVIANELNGGIVSDSGVTITGQYIAKATVTVNWNSYDKDRNVALSTYLTDWKPADYGWGISY